MADAVGIGEKTEKVIPKIPARATHIYEAWKIEASSEHALRGTRHGHRRAGKSRGLRFSARVTAKVAVCENLFQKGSTVSGRRTNLRVNRSGKTEIKMAGSENQLIKMKNF